MILKHAETVRISRVLNKPIIVIYNDVEGWEYYYLVSNFTPINPSNHIHINELMGQCINNLIMGVSSSATGQTGYDEVSLLTKINEIPQAQISFSSGFKWIMIK